MYERISGYAENLSQLAELDGGEGVRTMMENHDAWLANGEVMGRVTAAMRVRVGEMGRDEVVGMKVREQAGRLAGLVVRLPMRVAAVG